MQPWTGVPAIARNREGRLVRANSYARLLLGIPEHIPDSELSGMPEFHVSQSLADWDMDRYRELWEEVWRHGAIRQTVVLRVAGLEIEGLVQRGVNRGNERSIDIFILSTGRQAAELQRAREAMAKLTVRERQVAEMVAQGYSTMNIAARLEISPRTVDAHRAKIAAKLGESASPAQLTRLVFLGSPPDSLAELFGDT